MINKLVLLHLPLVFLLAGLSLQAARSFRSAPFLSVAAGWVLNLSYLLALRYGSAQVLGIPVDHFVTPLALLSSGGFWAAAHMPLGRRRDNLSTRNVVLFAISLLTVAVWVQFAANKFGGRFPAILLSAVPASAFAAAALYSLFTFFRAFSLAYARREINAPLKLGCVLYFGIQFLYPLTVVPFERPAELVTRAAFILGLGSKFCICFGLFKLVTDALVAAREQEVQVTEAKNTVRIVAHELGTPVGEIQVHLVELRRTNAVRGQAASTLSLIESALHRVEAIMEATHSLAALDYDLSQQRDSDFALADTFEPVSINSLIQVAVMAVKRTRDEDVRYELRFGGACGIYCVKHEIVQIFINLFRNSCDAFRRSGRGKIVVTTGRDRVVTQTGAADVVTVLVEDNGEGIRADLREAIFDLGVSTRSGPGRGHGLAIVKQLVAHNRGTVTLLSVAEYPSGAAFRLQFPWVRLKRRASE